MTSVSLSKPITQLSFSDIALPRTPSVKAHGLMARTRKDIKSLAKRILKDGLLNPIHVAPLKSSSSGAKFIVVDGFKRLA